MSIKLIIGPMFSEKTTTLIADVSRYLSADKKCVVIKHMMDVRYDPNNIATHSGIRFSKCNIFMTTNLTDWEANDEFTSTEVIGVTEGHFFTNISNILQRWARFYNKIVIVEGLSGDYKQEIFPEIAKLIPVADNIQHNRAVCEHCKQFNAVLTIKTAPNGILLEVGGKDKYVPICTQCKYKMESETAVYKITGV